MGKMKAILMEMEDKVGEEITDLVENGLRDANALRSAAHSIANHFNFVVDNDHFDDLIDEILKEENL